MSNEYIKYLVMVGVLITILIMYFNHYAKWHIRLNSLAWTFRLLICKVLRFTGMALAFANFFVYIVGSYFMTENNFPASNGMLILMTGFSVTCIIALCVANNGFKVETTMVRIEKGHYYE
jgi:hypothetical protein